MHHVGLHHSAQVPTPLTDTCGRMSQEVSKRLVRGLSPFYLPFTNFLGHPSGQLCETCESLLPTLYAIFAILPGCPCVATFDQYKTSPHPQGFPPVVALTTFGEGSAPILATYHNAWRSAATVGDGFFTDCFFLHPENIGKWWVLISFQILDMFLKVVHRQATAKHQRTIDFS